MRFRRAVRRGLKRVKSEFDARGFSNQTDLVVRVARKAINANSKNSKTARTIGSVRFPEKALNPETQQKSSNQKHTSQSDTAGIRPPRVPFTTVPKPQDETASQATKKPPVVKLPATEPVEIVSKLSDEEVEQQKFEKRLQILFKEGRHYDLLRTLEDHPERAQGLSKREKHRVSRAKGFVESIENPIDVPRRHQIPLFTPIPKKLLYFVHQTPKFTSNGYVQRTLGLLGAVSKSREVVVAARPGYPWDQSDGQTNDYSFELEFNGIRFTYMQGGKLIDPLPTYFAQAIDANVRRILTERPAVVQSASNYLTAFPAMVAARIAGVPFVYEVRGLWELGEPRIDGKPNDRYRAALVYESLLAKHADKVLVLNDELKPVMIERGAAPEKVEVLPNGVDLDEFYGNPIPPVLGQELGIDTNAVKIAYVGSMVEYEGLDHLVRVFKRLYSRNKQLQLLFIGKGPVRDSLLKTVTAETRKGAVLAPGAVKPSVARQYLQAADIVVIPRKDTPVTRIVSPLKPLEALAAGKAVVMSDLPVSKVYGTDAGGAALLVTAGDEDALEEQLQELIQDEERRNDLGRLGKQWVRENRSWDHIASHLGSVIDRLEQEFKSASSALYKPAKELKIALISDEFSRTILSSGAAITNLDADTWQTQIEDARPDFVMVESAWEGLNHSWNRRIGYYSDEESQPLFDLLDWCRREAIPAIFWNKEDPVHFNRFVKNAVRFDYIFTTDAGSIKNYVTKSQGNSSVFSLPFYASPALHHPVVALEELESSICFAGTYYGERFADRTADFDAIASVAQQHGLTIYDRQTSVANSPYHFPKEYEENVRPGIPYSEVPDLYRRHPIHININSVRESGTMFARRVVEIASCGRNVISNPSQALAGIFGDKVPRVSSSVETSKVIDNWRRNPDEMFSNAWDIRRTVRQAHSMQVRLALVARILGLDVLPEQQRYIELITESVDSDELTRLVEEQSYPHLILPNDGKNQWKLRWNGRSVDNEVITDLHDLALDMKASRVDLSHSDTVSFGEPLAVLGAAEDPVMSLVTDFGDGPVITIRQKTISQEPVVQSVSKHSLSGPRKVLVAGHDLKFAQQIISAIRDQGHEIKIDQWSSHNGHDVEHSRELLEWADTIFCEWGLGAAVWYSKNKKSGQRMTVRIHSQEVFSRYLRGIVLSAVDEFIFIAEHISAMASQIIEKSLPKYSIIPNILEPVDASIPPTSPEQRRFNIGLVGVVPMQKGLHRALDLLEHLIEIDPRYNITVKGQMPSHYRWMMSRTSEIAYYYQQMERIMMNSELRERVHFDGFTPNLEAYYQRMGVVLSLSNFESQHLTVYDGARRGAIPYVLNWPGSEHIYSHEIIFPTVGAIADQIISDTASADEWEKKSSSVVGWSEQAVAADDALARSVTVILGS